MKIVHQNYKDIDGLKNYMVEQGKTVTFVFPNTFNEKYQLELKNGKGKLTKTCSCTEYTIQPELEQITFIVKAPDFGNNLSQPYLKEVNPKFTASNGDVIEWDIKFFVKSEK